MTAKDRSYAAALAAYRRQGAIPTTQQLAEIVGCAFGSVNRGLREAVARGDLVKLSPHTLAPRWFALCVMDVEDMVRAVDCISEHDRVDALAQGLTAHYADRWGDAAPGLLVAPFGLTLMVGPRGAGRFCLRVDDGKLVMSDGDLPGTADTEEIAEELDRAGLHDVTLAALAGGRDQLWEHLANADPDECRLVLQAWRILGAPGVEGAEAWAAQHCDDCG